MQAPVQHATHVNRKECDWQVQVVTAERERTIPIMQFICAFQNHKEEQIYTIRMLPKRSFNQKSNLSRIFSSRIFIQIK